MFINDDYVQVGGEDDSRSLHRPHAARQQQFPQGFRFPPLPMWTPAHTQQHVAPHNVKLPPFWPKDPSSWFTLVESTFNRHHVVDSRLRFDLVLPALLEKVIDQVSGVLRMVVNLDHPYMVGYCSSSPPSRRTRASSSSSAWSSATGDPPS